MTAAVETKTTKEVIEALLDELPPESLTVVRQFVEFLRQQAQQGRAVVETPAMAAEPHPPYRYPTVVVPFSTFEELSRIPFEGYEGDALADTEALYDED